MIWLVFALLTGGAVAAVLWPLARKAPSADRGAGDIAFFEAQTREIEREQAGGLLSAADAETAKAETARRLLRARERAGQAASSSRRNAIVAALAALFFIPALSLLVYSRLGHFEMADAPLQARLEAAPGHTDIAAAVARIETHLAEHPDDGRGFEVIAPYYMRNGRAADAVRAFGEALRVLGPTAQRHAALGEARILAASGAVTPEAKADFEAALRLEPSSKMARYYLGLAAAQAGERDKAKDIWSKLLSEAAPGAAWGEIVRAQLAKLEDVAPAAAPSGERAAKIAALPEAERLAAVRSMVEGLRGKLEKKGDDVEGWLKLVRSYIALSETGKAKKALASARKALSRDRSALGRIDTLAKELGIGG